MIRKHIDLELQVECKPAGGGYRVRASIPGRMEWCEFEDPFTAEELDALHNGLLEQVSPRDLGRRLFERVFAGPVRDLLNDCLRMGWRSGVRLRLRPAPEVPSWPWELLHDRDDFLVLSGRTPVVRHLHSRSFKSQWAAYPLRVLVVICSPRGCESLDGERELKEIRNALGWRVTLGIVKAERLEPPTLEALEERLSRERFHVLHFIGHGGFERGQGVLLFEDADKLVDHVDGKRLGGVLGERVRLVVLNACESARSTRENPFSGVAQSLVRKSIPAVVAMQHPIEDDMAVRFARRFYGALAGWGPVDWAVTRARHALHAAGMGLAWAVPVLFLSSKQSRLFRLRPSFHFLVSLVLIFGLRFLAYPGWYAGATAQEPIPPRTFARPCPAVKGLDMEFVRIPAGTFLMGSEKDDEKPVHEVVISRTFCLGVYEVTQKQWETVIGLNSVESRYRGDDLPVTSVTWEQVQDFLGKVNQGAGRNIVRLPTEAEWEYAARGLPAAFNCRDDVIGGLAPVRSRRPNPWGLHYMHGNVWEWVQDWYGPYPLGPVTDPQGPSSGKERVKRGGGYDSAARSCRPAKRNKDEPGSRRYDLGFRILRELDVGSGAQ